MTSEASYLYFDLNSHVPRARERRKLDQIAPALQDMLHESPELIEGHSDDRKLREYNPELGSERADAVRRVLLNRSFREDRVRAVSFGDRPQHCLTPDDLCRQKNRRVHFRATQAMQDDRGRR
jgi:outer membrane protein OmpA-like peptidoglycan-associated protein